MSPINSICKSHLPHHHKSFWENNNIDWETLRKLERRAMEATSMMKILVFGMLLVVAVHADTVLPPSIDSPPSEFHIPSSPPKPCKHLCIRRCSMKHGLRGKLCLGKCFVRCQISSPSDHAVYHCTQDCVTNKIHHQPGKNII